MLSRVFVGLHSGQSSASVTHGTYPSLSLYTCLFGLYSGCITHCTHPCLSLCLCTHLFGLHSGQSSGCITDCTHLCLCVCVSLTLSLYACLFGLRSGQSSGCITAHVSLSMYVSCVCVCVCVCVWGGGGGGWVGSPCCLSVFVWVSCLHCYDLRQVTMKFVSFSPSVSVRVLNTLLSCPSF